jgi:hypothetical protein
MERFSNNIVIHLNSPAWCVEKISGFIVSTVGYSELVMCWTAEDSRFDSLQGVRNCPLLYRVQTDLAVHPASYPMGTGCSCPGAVNWPVAIDSRLNLVQTLKNEREVFLHSSIWLHGEVSIPGKVRLLFFFCIVALVMWEKRKSKSAGEKQDFKLNCQSWSFFNPVDERSRLISTRLHGVTAKRQWSY